MHLVSHYLLQYASTMLFVLERNTCVMLLTLYYSFRGFLFPVQKHNLNWLLFLGVRRRSLVSRRSPWTQSCTHVDCQVLFAKVHSWPLYIPVFTKTFMYLCTNNLVVVMNPIPANMLAYAQINALSNSRLTVGQLFCDWWLTVSWCICHCVLSKYTSLIGWLVSALCLLKNVPFLVISEFEVNNFCGQRHWKGLHRALFGISLG